MWLFLSNSFLSIVAHPKKSDILIVRARVKGDIEKVFPHAKVEDTMRKRKNKRTYYDYGFRAEIPKKDVTIAISCQIEGITYNNFKESVSFKEPRPVLNRHQTYIRVWAAMANWQDDLMHEKFQ